jgi:hypothetical protein
MAFRGYVGDYGAGKTYNMVADAFAAHQRGRRVFSNVTLRDMRVKRDVWSGNWYPVDAETFGASWSQRVTTWDEILRLDNALVLLDEIGAFGFGSANWDKISKNRRITGPLHQQRKNGIDVWYTSQLNGMVHNQIRDLTPETWECSRRGSVMMLEMTDSRAGKKGRFTKRARRISSMVYDLYDTTEIVGDGETGEGYGKGASLKYATGLRTEQRVCLIRKYGPEVLGLEREERSFGGGHGVGVASAVRWRWSHAFESA